jgi:tRNA A37 threonylcarbamoyltransferase TsaD
MPGAALEKFSQINQTSQETLNTDIETSRLPRPLSGFQKNIPAFSFAGLRSAVERLVESTDPMEEEERRRIARAGQVLSFEHVAEKCVLGIKSREITFREGNLVVSGGVASNMAFRKMLFFVPDLVDGRLRDALDRSGLSGYNVIFPPGEYCTVCLRSGVADLG